mgnify:CR=1 FL=1
MTDLFVVYGSETKLLNNIFLKKNVFFIRIYNKSKPSPLKNAVDVNNFKDFKIEFKNIFKKKNIKNIIFIGAATIIQNSLLVSESSDSLNLMLNTNINNYVNFTHFLLPFMIKIRSGNFIFLSSFRSIATTKGASIYSASKAFGETFFQIIGKEYGALGIFSNTIRLGCFDGRGFHFLADDKKKDLIKTIGNRKLGTSEDLLKAIDFVLDCKYSNGGILDLTAGMSYN